jgi:hypothetical protein
MSTRIKRLSFEMLYCKAKSKNEERRKQHCITAPLIAYKIGRQTRHGLARNIQETEDFF